MAGRYPKYLPQIPCRLRCVCVFFFAERKRRETERVTDTITTMSMICTTAHGSPLRRQTRSGYS